MRYDNFTIIYRLRAADDSICIFVHVPVPQAPPVFQAEDVPGRSSPGFFHHLLAIRNFLADGKIGRAEEYLNQYMDLSVLLGNLLDNAVKAAGHAPEAGRFVRLNMICCGKMLAVTVDNGFDGTVRRDGERYLSTKENHQGIGLKSITDISEKYHGGVEFTHEGTEFHASVMLGLE